MVVVVVVVVVVVGVVVVVDTSSSSSSTNSTQWTSNRRSRIAIVGDRRGSLSVHKCLVLLHASCYFMSKIAIATAAEASTTGASLHTTRLQFRATVKQPYCSRESQHSTVHLTLRSFAVNAAMSCCGPPVTFNGYQKVCSCCDQIIRGKHIRTAGARNARSQTRHTVYVLWTRRKKRKN